MKNRPYAVPLFAYLDSATAIDDATRRLSTSHIDLAFRFHAVTRVDGVTLEKIIFAKSSVSGTFSLNKQLLVE